MTLEEEIRETVVDIADFPKPGILFKDINGIFLNPVLGKKIIESFATFAKQQEIDIICGIESRGFFFGLALAWALDLPFVPIRKQGKLPGPTSSIQYDLEYGTAVMEIQKNKILPNQKVLIHDDLLATGGTAGGAAQLMNNMNLNVQGFSFLVELESLQGRKKINQYSNNIQVLTKYN